MARHRTIVRTTNGSRYVLDWDERTWSRPARTERSGDLRSDGGPFSQVLPIRIGGPLVILCPPIEPGNDVRIIATSDVVSVRNETREARP